MFDIKALENDQIYKWNVTKDHEGHLKRIDEITKFRKPNLNDPLLVEHIKHMHQSKELSRKMIRTEKNSEINRNNQLLFGKIIEISRKNNDLKDLGKTYVSRKRNEIEESSLNNLEPTLHYYYRKKQAEQIAEANESLAKRIIQQPPTLKRDKINKDIITYLEVRFQMQRFKNYFAEPPKKKKFKKRKIILSPIINDNSLTNKNETIKIEERDSPTLNLEKTDAKFENKEEEKSDEIIKNAEHPINKKEDSPKKLEVPLNKLEEDNEKNENLTEEPNKKTEDPIKNTEDPIKKTEDLNDKTKDPSKKIEEITQKTEDPPKKIEIHDQITEDSKTENQTSKMDDPTKKNEDPTKKIGYPTKKIEDLTQKIDIPPKKTETPPQKSDEVLTNNQLQAKDSQKPKTEEIEKKLADSSNMNDQINSLEESKTNTEKKIQDVGGNLLIIPKNAELIISKDLSNEMQTLIRIKLWDQTVKTKISRNKGKNPIWNQNLTVARNLQCKTQNIANIEIWENDEWNANKFLGSSLLNIDELDLFGDKKKNAKWIDLVNENKNIGRVLLSFEWKLQEKKVVTPINPWNTEEKLKESKEKMSKGANNKQIILNSKKSGLLVIRPKRADLTSPKNALPEDMEAYIRALMGKEIVQGGSSLTKGEKLQWTYSLNLKRKTNETDISLELWYKDNFSGNYLKGKINIDLLKTNVFLDAKPEIWFDIRNEDDEIIGKMLIGLEWKVISLKKKNN